MTHVHYKFSSKLSYDTVVFDGPHITLTDLKRQIMGREKLRAGDCDLQITNAQTKQEYTDNEGLIPKGSSVIVRRIPISGGKSSSSGKNQNIERSDVHLHHAFAAVKAMNDQASSSALPFFSKMANLADADVSEEDKIKVMLNQSTYDTMNYNKKFGNVLPANYTCYRCGNTGHHIRNCPTSGQDKNFEAPLRIKKSTGIPRSFMVEVDDPNIKGAMLTNCGRYAIPAIDAEAYAIGKKEKPPFVPQEKPKSIEAEEEPVPDELLCLICHDLLSDAVVIPCCGNSYCDDCIRTTLLDSEDHVCPTCSQSNVSPDTLIANKFLRQAVNNFKKERGYTKSLTTSFGTSQSQNPTPTPSPVPTPPPLTVQSQSQKPPQSTHCQQDSLLHHPQAADTLPLSGNPPATTGPASSCNTPSTSLQTEQSSLEIPDKEAEGDLAAAAAAGTPSVLVSNKESTAAPSQLIPLVNHTTLAEQPQTVSVNEQQASLGPAPGHSGPSTCWGSSSSSSGCPNGGWTESQRLTSSSSSSSSSYSATTPSLFPSPLFHTYLSAHQSHSSYPPGYPPTTPIWTLPCPQGAPIPSLCSSISTSSIPALIPKEWYKHQRKNKERSPHRGSSYRRSSSRSNSKSSKSKSSRSYSRSSSRSGSRSRSRSQGRSRPRSPYSRHRDLHTRSHPSHSYSYGYKRPRSPTPSSSSSPQVGYHSKSKSPSDHRKNRHHSRHHTKKSPSSSYSSRRRGEHSGNEEGGSGASLASSLYAHHANQTNSLELERERYLQWKKEYKEWCDKYFSSYVGHFHQLPPPFINLPPPPQWEGSKNHSDPNSDSHYGHTARTDGHSPLSQSSSDSRSPSSQSSSDSRSTPSQSSSVSRSSPSHTSNDSCSPPSQSSSDGRCTPSEEGAQPRAYQQQKDSHLPITLAKGSKEVELQERSKEDKQVIVKNLEDLSTLKHQQRRMKKHEEGRGEESSSCDATDSTDDSRKNERGHDTGPHACKDGTFVQDKAAARDTLKSFQPSLKPDKSLDKDCERKSREQRNVETEKGWRRGKDSRQDVERQHKVKPSKEADRVDSERYNNFGGSKASDSRSEKNRKRKGENLERNETRKNESPNPFDSKKQKTEKKKERKTWPPTEKPPLWEGGITVKPQKKISININLDGRRMEEKTEIQGSIVGKSKDEIEKTGDGEEEKLNTEDEVNEKKESIRENESVFEEKIMPDEGEARQFCEKPTLIDDKREMWKKFTGGKEDREKKEDRKEEDFYLWHYAFRGEKEEKGSKKQRGGDGMKASKGDATGKEEEEERMRKESRGQEMRELARAEGESTSKENKGNLPGDSKPKEAAMEGVKMRTRTEEEDMLRFMSQRSSAESSRDRPNSNMDGGSSCEDCWERRAVVKTVEEYTQERAAEREDPLVLVQVPDSKWEMDEPEEEEQNEGEIKAEDPLPVVLPPPLVTTTKREGEGENELKRQRSVDRDGDRDRAMQRGGDREKQKNLTLFSLDESVAPSSGKDRTDSTLCTERKMETERWRDRTRGRESERQRDRQRESRRSNERSKEEEKGRDRGREREHSSLASVQKRNSPSTGHVSSYSTYQDIERRDRQRGGEQDREKRSSLRPDRKHSGRGSRERSSMSRAAVLPDKHAHKTYGDTLLDSKCKDKNHPHDYRNHRDPSGSHRHQGRLAGTHHSSPSHSHSQGREGQIPPSESSSPKTSKSRMSSPGQEFMQSRSRNERKEEKQEWKRNKVNKVIEESKGERETREMEAEGVGVSQWQDEADKLSGEIKWQGGGELEEGERPSSGSRSRSSSSVSSSASQDKSRDDKRNERKKKQKHHKKEKSQATPELLEEWELKKHKHKKKTKKNRDGREEESGGEVDDRWKEEEDHAKLCSVMLS